MCNDWSAEGVKIADGDRNIIGRDRFAQLDVSLNQSKQVNSFD